MSSEFICIPCMFSFLHGLFLQQIISSCILVTHISAPTSSGPHDPGGQRSKLKRTRVNLQLFSRLQSNRMTSDQASFLPTYPDGTPIHDFLNPETSPFFAHSDDAIHGNPEDDTPAEALARAASEDNIDVVKDLLQQGVEISDETRILARSPPVWQLLLDHGVEINPYPSAQTPLLYVFSTYTSGIY